jgi:outer membrane protein assembly factor BamB
VNRRRIQVAAVVVTLAVAACGGGSSVSSNSPSPNPTAIVTNPRSPSPLGADWAQYHGNAARSGVGPSVPALGKPQVAWKIPVDGQVYASPLIVAGHVLVATENNTVYSLDIFTGSVVWNRHLGDPVASSSLPCGNIGPITGITGTPVADTATGRLYVVAFLSGHHHMLFTLSLADGSVLNQLDIDPVDSTPAVQQQRGALALASGYIYIPLGGLYGDCGTYHGYVIAVPEIGTGPVLTYRTPGTREAGIWSPAGATISDSGSVYAVTGNGSSQSSFDYSNSVLKLTPDLRLQSYFAPSEWKRLNATDTDLGSVGATLLPTMDVVISIGKEGIGYLLGADQLGGVGGQIASAQVCAGAWGGTAWSGPMVYIPCADGLVALSVKPTSFSVAWKVGHPVLGSPIIAAGALWAIEPDSGTLYALDPSSGAQLYSTGLGGAMHFSSPAATEGFIVAPAGTNVVAISMGG